MRAAGHPASVVSARRQGFVTQFSPARFALRFRRTLVKPSASQPPVPSATSSSSPSHRRVCSWILALLTGLAPAALGAAPAAPPPRLTVVVSVDQFRADYLARFAALFGEGGFRRLLEGGTVFADCQLPYASTKTAVGHATMLSGVAPDVHGIVGNEWIDRESWREVKAVEDAAAPLVGMPEGPAPDPAAGRSPRRFLATTVGDQLKLRYGAAAKVFGASNKDRAAILMAGKLADAAFWDESGRFVTSRYYREALPAWVERFNAEGYVASCFGKTWERLRDVADYDRIQGSDDGAGEYSGEGLGRTFPHKFDGGAAVISPAYFSAFDNAPFSSEFLAAFARRLVQEEQLGRDEVPDLLCLSFSQPDTIGHNYGPDSHEVMDSILRLDRTLAEFFAFLEREVGLAHCVIVLTADHGAAPLPERVAALRPGIPNARVKLAEFDRAVAAALDARFGALPEGQKWCSRDNAGYDLQASVLQAKNVGATEASAVIKAALLALEPVAAAFTLDEILAAPTAGTSTAALVRRSYFPARGQDVLFVLKPYFIDRANTGTTHGGPWDYDTHVPLVWWGAGVPKLVRTERVETVDLAPTLAELLRVPRPPQSVGRVLF